MFGSILKAARGAVRAVGSVSKVPILGKAVQAIPVVGTVASVGGLASDLIGGGGRKNLPALPGMPALPGTAAAPAIVGNRGVFRNDANLPDALKSFAISKGDLRVQYRSPLKGYVLVRDQVGDPVALPKAIARMYYGWKPAKKPPISVGDHQALLRADRTVKKVRKIMATVARVDKHVGKGGKVKFKKKGG